MPKSSTGSRHTGVPLARALSKLGVMSRTQAIERILSGGVRVGGRVIRDPGHPVIPERVRITVDGERAARVPRVTILFNKPRGVVTTRRDPNGRPTIYDAIGSGERSGLADSALPYLAPVGRLDMASTGLLLLTNDSRFGAWLLDPANGVPRVYIVTVRGELSDESARRLRGGIRDRGELLEPRSVDILKRSGRETHVRVALIEGRNREVRRLLAACGHEVTRLKRVTFGGLELGSLPPGRWRTVSPSELRAAFPRATFLIRDS